MLVAGEGGGVVGVEGGDELGAGFVGLLGDAADERQGVDGSGDDELLIGLEAGADADGDFGEAVELVLEGEKGEGGGRGGGRRAHDARVGGRREDRKSWRSCADGETLDWWLELEA